jgi:hypothetical protein
MIKKNNMILKTIVWVLLFSLVFTNISSISVNAEIIETSETVETIDEIAETTASEDLTESSETHAGEEQVVTPTDPVPTEVESAESTEVEESTEVQEQAEVQEPEISPEETAIAESEEEQPASTEEQPESIEEVVAEAQEAVEESLSETVNDSTQSDEVVTAPKPAARSIQSQVTRYIYANSIIRSAPNGSVITTLKMPLFVTGTIQGSWFRFTYNGNAAYVATSVTTTNNPAITGYAKSAVNVRNASGATVLGTIPKGYEVKGVLVGNRARFTYNGQTGYVYVSTLQGTPIQITCYIYANSVVRNAPNGSVITTLKMPLFVTGTIHGSWIRFIYNGKAAYVAQGVTTSNNPPITGYAKNAINVRKTPGGAVLGTIAKGYEVKGVLVGNSVRFTYKGQTGYVYASLLQGTPIQTTCYIYAKSVVRNAPNGSVVTTLWRPLFVTGTIQGSWLRFTYNGKAAYVAMGVTTTSNPAMTGYAKQKLNVRNTPSGSVIGTLALGRQVKGVLVGNMVRFTYNGKNAYVYATLLQKDPVKVTGYASQNLSVRSYSDNSVIGTLFKGRPVSGQLIGNKVVFTYNNKKATVYYSLVSTKPVTYKGYVMANAKKYFEPNGNSYDSHRFTNDITGVWQGDWLKVDYRGITQYVYKSDIRDYKPSSYGVSYTASYGSTVTNEYKNALSVAKQYLKIISFSKQDLYEQLLFEKFSEKAAQYATENCGANWYQEAVKSGRGFLKTFPDWNKQNLYDQLSSEAATMFTQDQARYAVDVIFK